MAAMFLTAPSRRPPVPSRRPRADGSLLAWAAVASAVAGICLIVYNGAAWPDYIDCATDLPAGWAAERAECEAAADARAAWIAAWRAAAAGAATGAAAAFVLAFAVPAWQRELDRKWP